MLFSIFIFDYPTFFRDEGNIISSVNSLRNLIKPQNKNLPTEYSLSVGIAFIEILIYYHHYPVTILMLSAFYKLNFGLISNYV